MKNPTKPRPNSRKRAAFVCVNIFAIGPVVLFIPAIIQIYTNPDPAAGMGMLLIGPLMILASFMLFIDGIVLIVHAIRRSEQRTAVRIAMGVASLLMLVPGAWFAYEIGGYWYTKSNAGHVISSPDALKIVQECKADSIFRGRDNLKSDTQALVGKIYLKKSAQSQFEKDSFYGYRSFNPDYYDELFKATQSDDVRHRCGYINYSDETRDDLPMTIKWATVNEAKQTIDTCSINEIATLQSPQAVEVEHVSNPQDNTGIFMTLKPSDHGFFGRLYLVSADEKSRSEILDFANKKKAVCVYNLPNIRESIY